MRPHVHDGDTSGWGWTKMAAHLEEVHGVRVPMSSTLSWVHEEHLKSHTPEKQQVRVVSTTEQAKQQNELDQVRVDRLIARMAGLDFDMHWASDNGIGSTARGLLREQYGKAAARLLHWLDRGGASAMVPQYGEIAEELREQLAVTGRQLEEAKAEIERRATGNQRNVGSIDALEARLAETADERDRALEAGRILEFQRDEFRRKASELDGLLNEAIGASRQLLAERDDARRERNETLEREHAAVAERNWAMTQQNHAQRRADDLRRRLGARSRILADGREALQAWQRELQELYSRCDDLNAGEVQDRIQQVLNGTEPPGRDG